MNDFMQTLLITFLGGAPTVIAVILSNKSHDKVVDEKMKYTDEKIADLSAKVEKHNNLIERMVVVEQSTKSAHHRLDDIVSQLKITERRK